MKRLIGFSCACLIIFSIAHYAKGDAPKNAMTKINMTTNDYSYTIHGLTVIFEHFNQNKNIDIIWDFGDGTTVAQPFTSHTYSRMGYYQTCMTIVDKVTTDSIARHCKTLEVAPTNDCDFVEDWVCGCDNRTYLNACIAEKYHGVYFWQPGICESFDVGLTAEYDYSLHQLTASFINSSFGCYDHFEWNFGDGYTATSRNPIHTYQTTGTYEVCLTVSSEFSLVKEVKDTICEKITIN